MKLLIVKEPWNHSPFDSIPEGPTCSTCVQVLPPSPERETLKMSLLAEAPVLLLYQRQ